MKQNYIIAGPAILVASTLAFGVSAKEIQRPQIKLDAQFHPMVVTQQQPQSKEEVQQMIEKVMKQQNAHKTKTDAGSFTHALTRMYSDYDPYESHYSYDDQGREIESRNYNGGMLTSTITTTYHDNDAVLKIVEEDYDSDMLIRSYENTFDEKGRIVLSESYDIYHNGEMTLTSRQEKAYTSDGETLYDRSYDWADGVLYLSGSTESQLDENGRICNQVIAYYDADGRISFGLMYDMTFTSDGLLETFTESVNHGQWALSVKHFFTYDEQRRIELEENYGWTGAEFLLHGKTEHTYTETGHVGVVSNITEDGWEEISITEDVFTDGVTETFVKSKSPLGDWYQSSYNLTSDYEILNENYDLDYESETLLPARLVFLDNWKNDENGNLIYTRYYQAYSPFDTFNAVSAFDYNADGDLLAEHAETVEEHNYGGIRGEKFTDERSVEYDMDLDGALVMGCQTTHPMLKSENYRMVYEKEMDSPDYVFSWDWPTNMIYEYVKLTPTGISSVASEQGDQHYNLMGQSLQAGTKGMSIIRRNDGSVSKVFNR